MYRRQRQQGNITSLSTHYVLHVNKPKPIIIVIYLPLYGKLLQNMAYITSLIFEVFSFTDLSVPYYALTP